MYVYVCMYVYICKLGPLGHECVCKQTSSHIRTLLLPTHWYLLFNCEHILLKQNTQQKTAAIQNITTLGMFLSFHNSIGYKKIKPKYVYCDTDNCSLDGFWQDPHCQGQISMSY